MILKRWLVGDPIKTAQAAHERLSKRLALAIFSSNSISSVAYATEEILLVLILAGTAALAWSIPVSLAILFLVIVLTISYRQIIYEYPEGGGAYIVARSNLGEMPALIAAAALMIDYVLTVAVSVAAGVAAITSAVPEWFGHRTTLGLLFTLFIVVVNLRGARIAVPRPDYWERDDVDPGVADVVRGAFAKLRDAGCTLVEIDLDGELRSIVGTIFQPTQAAVFAGDGMDAPLPTSLTMAAWLRENSPDVTVQQMYRERPIRDAKRTFPPVDEQVRVLKEAAQRYAEIYRAHNVRAIAFPTVPIVATRIRTGGPKEPLGEMMTIKGKQIEEGRAAVQNVFIAPRLGAAALSIPVGLSQGLPVGLEFDALPGNDSELLGLGIAIQAVVGRIPPPSF